MIKLPAALFDKDVEAIPPLVKQKVIPVLGLLALLTGIVLMFVSRREPPRTASLAADAVTETPNASTLSSETTPFVANTTLASSDSLQVGATPSGATPIISPDSPSNLTETISPSPIPTVTTVRFETGTNLDKPKRVGGRAWLRISNGTSSDAIAKLVDNNSGTTVRRVYIQAGEVATLQQVASGYYVLKFSLGSGYDKDSGRFLYSQSFSKFDNIMDFTVRRNGNRLEWVNHEVTLNPVPGGTAQTSSISADDFEDR